MHGNRRKWPVVLSLSVFALVLVPAWASGQVLRWEKLVADPDPREMSSPWYRGVHILLMKGDEIVLTGQTRGNFGSAVTRMNLNGEELWTYSITDLESAINPIFFPDSSEIYLWGLFSYSLNGVNSVFFGHQLFVPDTYGPLYLLELSADGRPVDTVAGTRDSVTTAALVQRWVRASTGVFVYTEYRQFSFDDNYNSMSIAFADSAARSTKDLQKLRRYYTPGQRYWEVQAHIPLDFLETANGDFVTWGAAGTVERSPYNLYRPFFHRVNSAGEELYATNPATQFEGLGTPRDLSTTEDGGFLGVYSWNTLLHANNRLLHTESVVIRLDARGERVWEWVAVDSNRNIVLEKVAELPDGDVVAAGWISDFDMEKGTGFVAGSQQLFAVRLSSEGRVVWQHEWGEKNVSEGIYGMLVLADGDVIVNGLGDGGMYVARLGMGISSVEGGRLPSQVNRLELR